MRNSKKVLFVLLCVAAAVAVVVGFLRMNMEQTFMETAQPADAFLDDIRQVTEEDGSFRTVVTVWYLVDGVEYVSELGGYHPSMKGEDGKILVYYQPDQPDVCYAPGTMGYNNLFVTGGTLALAAAAWLFIRNPFRRPPKPAQPESPVVPPDPPECAGSPEKKS